MEAPSIVTTPGFWGFYSDLRDDEWEEFRRMYQMYGDAAVISNLSKKAHQVSALPLRGRAFALRKLMTATESRY